MYLSNHGRICFTCSSGYSSLVHIVGVLKSSWQLLFNYSTVTFILLSSSMSITFDMKTKLSSSSLDNFAIVFLIPSLNCSETFPLMLSFNGKNITMTDFRFPQLPLCIPLKATDKGKNEFSLFLDIIASWSFIGTISIMTWKDRFNLYGFVSCFN